MFYYNINCKAKETIKISVPESVYFPREDSILIASVLEKIIPTSKANKRKILDMGCGSGFLSILARKLEAIVTAVDINPDAIEITKKNAVNNNIKLDVLISDLFSNITKKFDLIIFNPPYLPVDINETTELKGKETWSDNNTIAQFIQEVSNYLVPGGQVLMLVSSLTQTSVEKLLKNNGFTTKILATKKVPWEELRVICASS